MDLQLPVVGQEPGPTWATDINTALTVVDGHTHTGAGNDDGAQIPTAGININADLNFNSYRALGLKGALLTPQGSTPTSAAGQLHTINNSGYADLYFHSGTGGIIPIVQNGSVLANSNGFAGTYAANAQAYYNVGDTTFAFYATNAPTYDTSTHAHVVAGNVSLVRSSATLRLRNAAEGTTTGGWTQTSTSNNSWQLNVARATGSSTFDTALSVTTAIGSITGQTGLGINLASPQVVLDAYLSNGTTTNTTFPIQRVNLFANAVSPAAGYGPSVDFMASSTSSGAVTWVGQVAAVWSNVGSQRGGIYLYGYSGGVKNSVPGFAADGNGNLGFLAAPAATTEAISVGGSMSPTGAYSVGTTANRWSGLCATNADLAGTLVLASSSTNGLASDFVPDANATRTLGSTSKRFVNLWSAKGTFTAANFAPGSNSDLVTRHSANAVVAWGRYESDGTFTAGWNCSTNAAVVAATTGYWDVTLTQAVATTCSVIATVHDTAAGGMAAAELTDSTSVFVRTFDKTGANTNYDFSFVVIGAPAGSP